MENEKVLSAKGVRTEDAGYVLFKVSQLVDDKTTFISIHAPARGATSFFADQR